MRTVTNVMIVGVVVIGMVLGDWRTNPVSAADNDLPNSFSTCVLHGGDVRLVHNTLTCRLVQMSDFRVYGSGTTECGEEIMLEIWGETRTGMVTYFLQPTRAVHLPVVGEEGMAFANEPLPCLDEDP